MDVTAKGSANLPGQREFWNGRRVFITGHTGFKGSWLVRWLYNAGALIEGYSLAPPSQPNLFESAGVSSFVNHNHGDIVDAETLDALVSTFKPEIIFHLAAQPLVRLSYDEPKQTFSTNVMGTLNLLQSAHNAGVKAFVNVTTDKCYENKEWIWAYRENEPLGGHDPYSASKACAEILTNSFRLSYLDQKGAMRLASVRAGNVIGGGDWGLDRLVPGMMSAFSKGETANIRNPVAVRPWQHVLDALCGYLILGEKLLGDDGDIYAQAWNFGPDSTSQQTVGALAIKLQKLWGDGASLDMAKLVEGVHEAKFLNLDSTKARAQLGWKPHWNFDTVLTKTVEWYRVFYAQTIPVNQDRIRDLMDEQITDYVAARTDKMFEATRGDIAV